ncbi:exportin-5-like [Paramacrobiotus metropolitanus]|uniref:exportin-5-like n=1 Tax=Paramacrobiotus metropolitanus TaxID=2943436 RepID=UPI0024459C6C|nr:exportin-5-like [Paramacrobiotus metropolitanus]
MESSTMKLSSIEESDLYQILQVATSMVDPHVANATRMQAYHNYEELRRRLAPEQKLELGAVLAQNDGARWSSSVVHIGLQFLEDTVKYSWNILKPESKLLMKNIVFSLISGMDPGGPRSEHFILDGIGKIVVEMIKREWPQQWPSMLQELDEASRKGPTQLQIVTLILLRFIEDLMQFRSLTLLPTTQHRHRELSDSLMTVMPDLIAFLVQALIRAANLNLRPVSVTVIRLCSAIGEYTQVKYLWLNDGVFIDTLLSKTLTDEALQLEVADFLCCLLSRKYSKKDDIRIVLKLLSESKYFSVLQRIVNYAGPFSEQSYTSLKKFVETFVAIALQLHSLEELSEYLELNRENFASYISTLLKLTNHESPQVANFALNAWLTIWGNKVIRERPEVMPTAISTVQTCLKLLLITKLTDNQFLSMDFMQQDNSFKEFIATFRLRISELIKRIACCKSEELLDFSFSALQNLMNTKDKDQDRWTAVLTVLENSTKTVSPSVKTKFRPFAFQLMDALMAGDRADPTVVSMGLSCISRLSTAFISNAPPEHQEQCAQMLDKVVKYGFFLLTNSLPSGEKETDESVLELHRHAVNFFSHFCRNLTKPLVDRYDQLLLMLRDVFQCNLSTSDRCSLLDGLITVTKDCSDVNKQASLAGEIISAVTPFWQSADFCSALKSVEKFVNFFGLNQPLSVGFDDVIIGQRRKQLFFCSNIIASTFVHMKFSNAPVISLLENAVLLIDCLLQLRLPGNLTLLHKDNQKILTMPIGERNRMIHPVFGTFKQDMSENFQTRERLKNWLHTNLESACKIIGYAGRCLGTQFYQIPNLADFLQRAVFRYITIPDVVPIFLMRTIVRQLVSQFIRNCPLDAFPTIVIPVLRDFCPALNKMLTSGWDSLDLESDEQEEILQDILLRGLTRDCYALVMQPLLSDQLKVPLEDRGDDVMEDDSEASTHSPSPTSSSQPNNPAKPDDVEEISPIGEMCLHDPVLANAILMTVFTGLHWPDTNASQQFARFAQMLIPRLARKEDSSLNPEAVKYIFQSILVALNVHGQHDASQATLVNLGLFAYFLIKPLFGDVVENVLKPLNCDMEKHKVAVGNLDGLLFVRMEGKNLYEKRKRMAFKKIVQDRIGRPLSEMERLQVVIPNLPPLRINKGPKKQAAIGHESDEGLGLASMFAVNGR